MKRITSHHNMIYFSAIREAGLHRYILDNYNISFISNTTSLEERTRYNVIYHGLKRTIDKL